MADLLDLAKRMEAKAKSIGEENSERAKLAAMTFLWAVGPRMPVDTSRALSNWQITLGAPATVHLEPYVPGVRGSTRGASMQAMFDAGKRALEAKKPGETIYITNNTPYILFLENGTSRIAPYGFTKAAMMIMRKRLKEMK